MNSQNKQINNWLEYIQLKFSDENYFEINYDNERFILVNSKTNKTQIWFYELSDDKLTLTDCQYSNKDVIGFSGELLFGNHEKYGIFNQENLEYIEEKLNTPIYNGWFSEDYYFLGNFLKSVSYEDKDRKKHILTYSQGLTGCLIVIFFPFVKIYEVISRSLRITKLTFVEPIIKKHYS